MPVTCGSGSVLTGQDGAVYFRPAATQACLLDKTDFPAGSSITLPSSTDFRVGDPIIFTEKGAANLSGPLVAGTTYYVLTRPTATTMTVSATKGGAAIVLAGDGGTGGVNTPGTHIEVNYAAAEAICEVGNVQLSLTRGEVDVTSLPCGPNTSVFGQKLAGFRRYQPGYADGNGSMTVRFTSDNASFANRLIQSSLFNNQGGAVLKVYLNAIADGGGILPDDNASLLAEFPVSLLGFDFSVTPEDTPTEATINFRLSNAPIKLFGLVA